MRSARTTFGGAVRSGDTVVTKVVIVLCVLMYGVRSVLPYDSYLQLELVNYPGAYPESFGAGNWWQPLTSAFLHAGLLHLLFNMYALWVTGQYLEPLLGRARFAALYLLSALGGAAGGLLLPGTANTLMVGASGAVFGLFAALLVVNRQLGRQTGQVVGLIVVNLVIGFVVPGISWQAHLGGLLTGGVVAVLLARSRGKSVGVQWLGVVAVAIVVLALLGVAATRLNA
ncbi:MAG: rhomboid family intramembrane serine protease [Janthinobacterium lividum]